MTMLGTAKIEDMLDFGDKAACRKAIVEGVEQGTLRLDENLLTALWPFPSKDTLHSDVRYDLILDLFDRLGEEGDIEKLMIRPALDQTEEGKAIIENKAFAANGLIRLAASAYAEGKTAQAQDCLAKVASYIVRDEVRGDNALIKKIDASSLDRLTEMREVKRKPVTHIGAIKAVIEEFSSAGSSSKFINNEAAISSHLRTIKEAVQENLDRARKKNKRGPKAPTA